MVTIPDIDKWDVVVLQHLFDTVDASGKTLTTLGENLDTVQQTLQDWGGKTADEYRADHGKTRTDIDDQHAETATVKKIVHHAITDVTDVKTELARLRQAAKEWNAHVTDDGKIVSDDPARDSDSTRKTALHNIQDELNRLLTHATGVDEETAAAIRAAITPQTNQPGGNQPAGTEPTASDPVAGPDGEPPYANGATPTMIQGALPPIPLTDNPPGSNYPPGTDRDKAWQDYLNGKNPDGTRRDPGQPPLALPKPEAVSDKHLRMIGAAGRQQGVSYAWGGNKSVDGPTRGHEATAAEVGAANYPDESTTENDDTRIGYDCGGLVRFATWQGAHVDVGMGTNAIDSDPALTHVAGGIKGSTIRDNAAIGDILVFGSNPNGPFTGSNTHHTAIYIGDGCVINAPSSGQPIRVESTDRWNGENTDILRVGS